MNDLDVAITDENFNEYFRDARQHQPERGEILACFSAVAYFTDGNEKRQIIDLLTHTDKIIPCTQVMRKLLFTSEIDSYRVPLEMAKDLLGGMSREKCSQKEYKYTVEMHFYAKAENVPKDDPHWQIISILNLDDFLARKNAMAEGDDVEIKSWIVKPEE